MPSFSVGDLIIVINKSHKRARQEGVVVSKTDNGRYRVAFSDGGYRNMLPCDIAIHPRLCNINEICPALNEHVRFRVTNKNLASYDKSGHIMRYCNPPHNTIADVKFDDGSGCKIGTSNISIDVDESKVIDSNEEDMSIGSWPKMVITAVSDEEDFVLGDMSAVDLVRYLNKEDINSQVSIFDSIDELREVIEDDLSTWEVFMGIIDNKPFVARRAIKYEGIDI